MFDPYDHYAVCWFPLFRWDIYRYSGPPYLATLTRSHPSYAATILENKLLVNNINLPLTNDHPSQMVILSIPQWWPYIKVTQNAA